MINSHIAIQPRDGMEDKYSLDVYQDNVFLCNIHEIENSRDACIKLCLKLKLPLVLC